MKWTDDQHSNSIVYPAYYMHHLLHPMTTHSFAPISKFLTRCKKLLSNTSSTKHPENVKISWKLKLFDWDEGFFWIRCEIVWNITFWTHVNMHRWQHYTDWTAIACCWVLFTYFGSINYSIIIIPKWGPEILQRIDWTVNLSDQKK